MNDLNQSRVQIIREELRQGKTQRETWAWCQCACGRQFWTRRAAVRSGHTRSCGCYQKECAFGIQGRSMTRHGQAKKGKARSRAYIAWSNMVRRCKDRPTADWGNYAGRGIGVDPAWADFQEFWKYLSSLPEMQGQTDIPPGLTIDRIRVNEGYKPGNIRLLDRRGQNRNQRRNRVLTVDGVSRCAAEWAEVRGIGYTTLLARLARGWDTKRALGL